MGKKMVCEAGTCRCFSRSESRQPLTVRESDDRVEHMAAQPKSFPTCPNRPLNDTRLSAIVAQNTFLSRFI